VVEDDDVDVELGAGGGERLDFSGAEERGRIGLGPLLQHAQHDLSAGRDGETGELVERPLRLEAARLPCNQSDERRPLLARSPRCSHSLTSSHDIAPARTRRGDSSVTSTMVDGAPPRAGPASSRNAMRSPNARSTSFGSAVAGCPLMFALVAVTGRPT